MAADQLELSRLRARHADLCERINEDASPFREPPLPVACAERDRLWGRIEELEAELAREDAEVFAESTFGPTPEMLRGAR